MNPHHPLPGDNPSDCRLIIFTRFPEPGTTKTRLVPALGAQGAADLQRDMTLRLLRQAARLGDGVSVEVCFDGGDEERMAGLYGSAVRYAPQGTGDLGERMKRALDRAFAAGAKKAVLVGSDIPSVNAALLGRAFALLDRHDLVLGPAADGGYYLIGLTRMIPSLFMPLPWGSDSVLARTMELARQAGVIPAVVDTLHDVDRPEDLDRWNRAAREETLSVIIPALNEEEHIGAALDSLSGAREMEIIVADGGSSDRTREIARSRGARVVEAPRGRARQMNAGAAEATGGLLLFLHADSALPRGFDAIVRGMLADDGVAAGAFRLQIADNLRGIRLIERLANWRARRAGLPYGDQGLFLRAETFRAAGGFPDQPLMEDFEFMRRIRRRGRIVIADESILASGRRWRRLGVLRTTLINQIVILGYHCGVSPDRLAKWYHGRSVDRDSAKG